MKQNRKACRMASLLLALMLCVGLFAGTVSAEDSVASGAQCAVPADSLFPGCDCLIVTEANGRYYALTVDSSGSPAAQEISVLDGLAYDYTGAALWRPDNDSWLQNVATGSYLFASSAGFLTYSAGRAVIYDAATETVQLHTKYYLTFADGCFNQTEDASAACRVLLFTGSAPSEPADPEGGARTFTHDTALKSNYIYLLTAEANGRLYAMATEDGVDFIAKEIGTVGDASIITGDTSAIWLIEGNTLKNTGLDSTPYLYPSSSRGLLTYGSGRNFTYDPETGKLSTTTSAGEFAITFDGSVFGFAASGGENDGKFVLYSAAADDLPAEDADNWEGKIDPATVPETNNVETIYRDAVKNADGSITLAFTSDVHYDGQSMNLATWLPLAEARYGFIDAMGFCGDMGSAYIAGEAYWDVTEDVMDYVDTQIDAGKIGVASYTFGNHEWFVGAGGEYMRWYEKPAAQRLQRTGPSIVTDDYIIYNFGASPDAGYDWMTYGYDTQRMYSYWEEDFDALDAYLTTAPADIPIFILTHYPLHSWQDRTIPNAAEIVSMLNQYPNVVVLWGHNHTSMDENYYRICHAGDSIVVDKEGTACALHFDYLAAGTTADKDYTGPEAGSAWTLNKGLIVTIKADGTLKYDYITMDGNILEENGQTIVEYRNNIDYEITSFEYVDVGSAADPPAIPEVKGYRFVGWDVDLSNIQQPTLATAVYEKLPVPSAVFTACTGFSASATVTNPTTQTLTAVLATYDAEGQLLSSCVCSAEADTALILRSRQLAFVRLFLLDESGRPVADALTAQP